MMAIALIGTTAFAEETTPTELKWSDVEEALKESGINGGFVTFDEVAVQLWLPETFEKMELTDEDRENGFIAYYETKEDTEKKAVLSVVYVDLEGMELSEYAERIAKTEGVEEK